MATKTEIRQIALDIIFGKEIVKYAPDQQAHLFLGIAEVLHRKKDGNSEEHFLRDPNLDDEEKLLALEVFWDLIIERIITPGKDPINPLPFFRIHSEFEGKP